MELNMELNLNLNEYSFSDLLHLFKITELNSTTLKEAYKLTLYTHPDKSGLDKMYFIFFSKAFKLLNKVFRVYHKKDTFESKTTNIPMEYIHDILNQENFSDVFNHMFDKLQNIDEQQQFGYDNWLKTNTVEEQENVQNMKQVHAKMEDKKKELAMIHNQGVLAISDSGYSITREKLDNYDSGIFSKLPYQDLKKACTETIIPVSSSSISPRNRNVCDYQRNRELSEKHYVDNSEAYIKNKIYYEEQENLEQLYALTQQFENENKNQELWWSYMKQIKNDI